MQVITIGKFSHGMKIRDKNRWLLTLILLNLYRRCIDIILVIINLTIGGLKISLADFFNSRDIYTV